jgi:hypothetical protein
VGELHAEHAASLASRGVELAERLGAPRPIGCALRVRDLAERDLELLGKQLKDEGHT